jgi:NDP-sugar pyrophosphorylase family protein
MILAAGLGTRLQPITTETPKCLVPVVGVPNIFRLIYHFSAAGIDEIVINTFHLSEELERVLGDGGAMGVHVSYSREEDLLGTGGGIKKALPLLGDETFLVANGDALFAPDIEEAVQRHRESGALATLLVKEDDRAETWGAVGLDETDRVGSLVGAGNPAGDRRRCIFTGFHVIEPEIGPLLPGSGCIVRKTYMPALTDGLKLQGLPVAEPFFDLGTPARYLEANVKLVTGEVRITGFKPPAEGFYLADGVEVGEGATFGPGAVVCRGARIAPGVHVERAVIMPGARADRDLTDVVVTADGSILQ